MSSPKSIVGIVHIVSPHITVIDFGKVGEVYVANNAPFSDYAAQLDNVIYKRLVADNKAGMFESVEDRSNNILAMCWGVQQPTDVFGFDTIDLYVMDDTGRYELKEAFVRAESQPHMEQTIAKALEAHTMVGCRYELINDNWTLTVFTDPIVTIALPSLLDAIVAASAATEEALHAGAKLPAPANVDVVSDGCFGFMVNFITNRVVSVSTPPQAILDIQEDVKL